EDPSPSWQGSSCRPQADGGETPCRPLTRLPPEIKKQKGRIFMKRTFAVFSIAAALYGLAPIARAADQKLKSAADDTLTIKLDVAMDTSSTRAGRPDWSVTGPLRGDTFVSNGLIYASGSIPDGDTSATF